MWINMPIWRVFAQTGKRLSAFLASMLMPTNIMANTMLTNRSVRVFCLCRSDTRRHRRKAANTKLIRPHVKNKRIQPLEPKPESTGPNTCPIPITGMLATAINSTADRRDLRRDSEIDNPHSGQRPVAERVLRL